MRLLRDLRRPYVLTLALYVLLRVGFAGIRPQVYTDTASYELTAHQALWSSGFWAGKRGFTLPLLYKIVPDNTARILFQLAFSIVAWSVLAYVVSRSLRTPRGAYVGFVVVLLFSLTRYIVGWDPLLLSESLSFSLFALVVAAVLHLVRRPSWPAFASLLLVAILWTFVRDSNVAVVLVGGLVALLLLARSGHRSMKLAIAGAAIALVAAAAATASAGQRWQAPFGYVLGYRLPEEPGLRRYMLAHQDPIRYSGPKLAGEWHTYLAYVATHPVYLLVHPFVGQQQAPWSSNSKAGSLLDPQLDRNVAALNSEARAVRRAFDVVWIHSLAGVLALAAAGLVAGVAALWRRPSPAGWIALAVLLSAYPVALATWHLEAGDIDRHALGAAIALRLGAYLLLAYAVDAFLAARDDERSGVAVVDAA